MTTQFPIHIETASNLPCRGPGAAADRDSSDDTGSQRRTRGRTRLAIRIVALFRTLTTQDHDPFIIL
jgi:hypothetical protein